MPIGKRWARFETNGQQAAAAPKPRGRFAADDVAPARRVGRPEYPALSMRFTFLLRLLLGRWAGGQKPPAFRQLRVFTRHRRHRWLTRKRVWLGRIGVNEKPTLRSRLRFRNCLCRTIRLRRQDGCMEPPSQMCRWGATSSCCFNWLWGLAAPGQSVPARLANGAFVCYKELPQNILSGKRASRTVAFLWPRRAQAKNAPGEWWGEALLRLRSRSGATSHRPRRSHRRRRASRDEGRDVRNAARPRDQAGATAFRRARALVPKPDLAPLFQGSAEPRPTQKRQQVEVAPGSPVPAFSACSIGGRYPKVPFRILRFKD